MYNYDITLRCMNGFTLYIKGTNLIVATKRSEETFPLSKIQSFELKEPGALSPGRIIFRTAQAATAGINLGFGIGASLGAEKSFFYAKSERDIAIQLRDYITGYDEKDSNKEHGKGVVSVVEEIRGLKTLVDEGILTQDEFEAKKKQLLNL
ncbi:MAG: SHOCT domain-containing protein [Eubacteriales bacterium]|nr:SHOCT domain-containing protein [Eubacteriales bacterium]